MAEPAAASPQGTDQQQSSYYQPPAAVELPKGDGAIRGIGEKFAVNPVTGTGSLSLPIFTTPGRLGFSSQLSLSYDSGAGNGVFGLGWNLSVPSVTRKTDKGLPRYFDGEDSDVFILSGAEDLVPVLIRQGDVWVQDEQTEGDFTIRRYRPRIEGLFACIERWQNQATGEIHWRSLSKDNVTSIYGRSPDLLHSQIADPADNSRVFKWLLEASYDDRGNLIVYEYKPENDQRVDPSKVYEGHRAAQDYAANVYLKRIWYGNRMPYRQATDSPRKDYLDIIRDQDDDWLFQVVFESVPNLVWSNPNLRFIDLNGDGHADILITQDDPFIWHLPQARQGFGVADQTVKFEISSFKRVGHTGAFCSFSRTFGPWLEAIDHEL